MDSLRQIVVFPGEDGYFVAECPSLPGCISQGETKEQAVANIREAIQGYVDALRADGYPVPEDHSPDRTLLPNNSSRHKDLDRGTLRSIVRQAGLSCR